MEFPSNENALDPKVTYKRGSVEACMIEQYMVMKKINLLTVKSLAVDKMAHPLTGEQIFVVPD